MDRVILAVALVALALAIAAVLTRRRPAPPTGSGASPVPHQLDRSDFDDADKPWLVVVFTSETCESCATATAKAEVLQGSEVGYQVVPFQTRRDLHDRYGVGVVPMTLIVDAEGVVQRSFIGSPPATDLWGALADARAPGAIPEHELRGEASPG